MFAIDTQDKQFHDGDGVTELGTILPAWWLNMMQAELLAVLNAAGISPNRGANNQVAAALNKLLGDVDGSMFKRRGMLTTENLNDLKGDTGYGVWGQQQNSNASPDRNYPVAEAGSLLVLPSAYQGLQMYVTFGTGRLYIRGTTNSNGDFGSWSQPGALDIINTLSSNRTDAALSAAQGKALSDLIAGKANKATTLSGYGITDAATAASVTALSNTKADKATSFAGYGITGSQNISGGRLTIDGTTYPSVVLQSAAGASDLWLESSGSSHYFVLRDRGAASGGAVIQLPSSAGTLALTTDTIPTGSIIYVAGNTAPAGTIKANGAAVSRTTYAALYAAIGTAYGAGNGSSTFNVPDLRGEFVRGWDDSRGVDAGRILGSVQSDQLRSHTHGGVPGYNIAVAGQANGNNVSGAYTVNPGQTQAAGGNETRPRNVALLACIKI